MARVVGPSSCRRPRHVQLRLLSVMSDSCSMASNRIPGAADTANKAANAREVPCTKRKFVRDDGGKPVASRVKHPRVTSTVLQSRNSNIGPRHRGPRLETAPPSGREPSDTLREFEYSESEIEILETIGSGDHAIVYRISAGGRPFVLKMASVHIARYYSHV